MKTSAALHIGDVQDARYSQVRSELERLDLRRDGRRAHAGICNTFDIYTHPIVGTMTAEHGGIELQRSAGEHRRIIGSRTVLLTQNRILAFNPLERHTEIYDGRSQHRQSIVLRPQLLNSVLEPFGGEGKHLEFYELVSNVKNAELNKLFSDLFLCREIFEVSSFVSECIGTSLILTLLASRKNTYSEKLARLSSENRFPGFLQKAKKVIIERHEDGGLNLHDLSTACGMSKFHFLRIFRTQTGMTPADYLTKFRIQLACARLKKQKSSIVSVANSSGFTDLSTFYRQFRKQMGCTPKQYVKSRA